MKLKNFDFKGLDIVSCLLKMRALRDSFSANERRIADFVIENSQFMRDYSSQQLATAINVSQSSIVKFSQKLGYKGYPDLKMAINESVVKEQAGNMSATSPQLANDALSVCHLSTIRNAINESLTHCESINEQGVITDFAQALLKVNKVFIVATSFGIGPIEGLMEQLLDLGKYCRIIRSDMPHELSKLQQLTSGDVLLIVEDDEFSNSLVSMVNTLWRQGVYNLLLNRFGDSQLYAVTHHQLQWVVTDNDSKLGKLQAETCLINLIYALELEITALVHKSD
ncbi:MurR/RpiR family transcriptional regulator [Thalassotalea sp. G2M2-11]|uniref:MurR/RpiR family transcriptional regulator n=1 Tax=Thalassotalea sp. G2M2-11 TaxID=2787627 RepID=UPI0019D0889B|nr:MurR/RpiR family transcriptional regulator [Thalassotalea sp. G2M2-11]